MMDMTLQRLREKINQEDIPEIDVKGRVMSQINKDKRYRFFHRKKFKFVFTSFLMIFIFSASLQGITLINNIFLGYLNNAEEGILIVKFVRAVQLDNLSANIKDFDLLTGMGKLGMKIIYFCRDLYYYILELF